MKNTFYPQARQDVLAQDQWNLSLLYPTTQDWEQNFDQLNSLMSQIKSFEGTLAQSKQHLKTFCDFWKAWNLLAEKLFTYAQLKTCENVADSEAGERLGRLMNVVTQAKALASFIDPEIQSIDDKIFKDWISDPVLKDDKIMLSRIKRFKAHTLEQDAERVLALGSEAHEGLKKAFSSLTNADFDFGTILVDGQEKPLTQSTYSVFLENPDPNIRKSAYTQFYSVFQKHENTLASLYAGSVLQDIALARARRYSSSRGQALFSDNVPEAVYDNLLKVVGDSLSTLHRYYELKRRTLGLERLHHSDVYAPFVLEAKPHHTYEQAVDLVIEAVQPLGSEYQAILKEGLLGGWVDRYENKGKYSGAFSMPNYSGPQYILMNYKKDSLRDVFTLAHEAGHSMHSWYAKQHNPFQHYRYSIFEAEIASTFNEQLLTKVLLEKASNKKVKAMILSKKIDDTVATLFRQTMFAEFEHQVHKHAEEGGALTLDYFKSIYRRLLEKYFGPQVVLEDNSALEGLRIPHFYNAFYVYQYATGIAASLALADRVLTKSPQERENYLNFLRSGGSSYPLENLKLAGVDLTTPQPIFDAIKVFSQQLDELEQLLNE